MLEELGYAVFCVDMYGKGFRPTETQDYAETQGELLILHGSADRGSAMQDFAALAAALEEEEVEHEMITYGGALPMPLQCMIRLDTVKERAKSPGSALSVFCLSPSSRQR